MHVFKVFVRLCVAVGVFSLSASYLGALHPLGDSLAVFRSWMAGAVLLLAVVAALLRDGRWVMVAGLAAAVATVPILGARWTSPPPPERVDVIVYVKNLGSARADLESLLGDIARINSDILLLQEVTRENAAILQDRLTDHPHRHLCQLSGWSGIAVISRWPITRTACSSHRSVAAAEVRAPDGPLWVASIHQVWPYPYDQAVHLPMVLSLLEEGRGRQVIAGDFNMVPWGHSVRAIEHASGTNRIGRLYTTINLRGVRMPIDHVLTNGRGSVDRRPQFGSDHYGLVAQIGWPEG